MKLILRLYLSSPQSNVITEQITISELSAISQLFTLIEEKFKIKKNSYLIYFIRDGFKVKHFVITLTIYEVETYRRMNSEIL